MKNQQNNNCKNNKPTDVKQDNKNKASGEAKNVKQDNKNCKNKADKLFNDTVIGGNRPAIDRYTPDDE